MKTSQLPDFDLLWNYSQPEETREKFNQILGQTSEQAPLDYVLQLKTQIARTYSLQARFAEAHRILDGVETKLSNETKTARVRYLLERGRSYNSAGEKDKALALFAEAYESGKSIGKSSLSIDGAHMAAIASAKLEDKLRWNNQGLEEARTSTDKETKRWIGVFHNNMGWDLFAAERYEEALVHFENCKIFYQQTGTKDRLTIAHWSIAKTYRFLGRLEDALDIQLRLLEESGGVDERGYTYEELGELYLLRNEETKSKAFFAKAHAILSQDLWLRKNEPARLARLKKLSE